MKFVQGNLPHMAKIGTAVMVWYVPMLLDFISLKDLGKYKLNIQVIQVTGAQMTPEIYEKIGEGFRKHGFDVPEILSAYGSTELGKRHWYGL